MADYTRESYQTREEHSITKSTYVEAVEEMYRLYGRDSTVLNHQTVTYGGFLGIGQKLGVKVTFVPGRSSLPQRPVAQQPVMPQPVSPNYRSAPVKPVSAASTLQESTRTVAANTNSLEEAKKKILNTVPTQVMEDIRYKELVNQIKQLNESLNNYQRGGVVEHPSIQKIQSLLERNEFSPSYIRTMVSRLRRELSVDDLEDFDVVQTSVIYWIAETIKIDDYFTSDDFFTFPQAIILVGPTGVGKTTTVAKLAANCCVSTKFNRENPCRVRLITNDTFRIQGQQQLESYAMWMDIPVSIAEKQDDLKVCFAQYKDRTDLFFVDTFGVSPSDFEKLGEARGLLDFKEIDTKVFLTISATTKASDVLNIIKQFTPFEFSGVILTKIDETEKIGNIVSSLYERNMKIALVTNGQIVPGDIQTVTALDLMKYLEGFEVNRERLRQRLSAKKADNKEK